MTIKERVVALFLDPLKVWLVEDFSKRLVKDVEVMLANYVRQGHESADATFARRAMNLARDTAIDLLTTELEGVDSDDARRTVERVRKMLADTREGTKPGASVG